METSQFKQGFDIVIVQTSESGNWHVKKIIDELGLSQRVYIFRNFGVNEIFEKLNHDRKQLFVTGTIRGSANMAIELAGVLIKKFPRLVCVGYASEPLPNPPFSECFVKDLSDFGRLANDRFVQYMVNFLKDTDG